MKTKAILRDKLYIPINLVTPLELDQFTYKIEDPACSRCSEKRSLLSSTCIDCPLNEPREIHTYKRVKGLYAFCRGNLGKIYKTFHSLDLQNETASPKFSYNLKCTAKLWNNQKNTIETWLKYKYGIIESPPRSGKTIMSCYIICALKMKTLVLAHQSDLLDQFYETFKKHTNLLHLREDYSTDKIIGLTDCREDISNYDICLATYQSFITNKGIKYLEHIQNSFGLVVIDEVHLAGADCYRKVVDRINSKHRLGLSATPKRKDQLECLVYDIIGPVTSKGISNEMSCIVEVHNTGYYVKKFANWSTFIRRLCDSEKRNEVICNQATQDVLNGRYVLIVTERRKHIDKLVKILQDKGIKAASFDARLIKSKRKEFLDRVRVGDIEVVVAMRKMIKLGIDVPLWDIYYHTIPMGYAENYYQEMSRVRTPYPDNIRKIMKRDKPTPIIRMFLDHGHKAVFACFNIANNVHKEQGFIIKNHPKEEIKVKPKILSW